jgi:hypothetical protein
METELQTISEYRITAAIDNRIHGSIAESQPMK